MMTLTCKWPYGKSYKTFVSDYFTLCQGMGGEATRGGRDSFILLGFKISQLSIWTPPLSASSFPPSLLGGAHRIVAPHRILTTPRSFFLLWKKLHLPVAKHLRSSTYTSPTWRIAKSPQVLIYKNGTQSRCDGITSTGQNSGPKFRILKNQTLG